MTGRSTVDYRAMPKAVLHEHLDGGLRVETLLDLADQVGYRGLPTEDPAALGQWFHQGGSGSLERYLEAFTHTLAVMQTSDGIRRVAAEAVEDLADDGVIYAEIRFAPTLNTRHGLGHREVLEAAWDGMSAAASIRGIEVGIIVTAMRQETDSAAVAEVARHARDLGVIGFDLAGPEAGYPPDLHVEACRIIRGAGLGLTIHAGEGDGVHSMWVARARCGAQRIGHGVRIVDDTDFDGEGISAMGPVASAFRDHRIPLEVAMTSNLHTGAFSTASSHPLGALHRAGFVVSINTDNRLMSGVTVSGEYQFAAETFGLSEVDLRGITKQAILDGFAPYDARMRALGRIVAG